MKGYSVLHNFMSIADGCPVDYMHCILQGIIINKLSLYSLCKTHQDKLILIFAIITNDTTSCSRYWKMAYNCHVKSEQQRQAILPNKQRVINDMLLEVHVPYDIYRKPRSLEYLKYWKGLYHSCQTIIILFLICINRSCCIM